MKLPILINLDVESIILKSLDMSKAINIEIDSLSKGVQIIHDSGETFQASKVIEKIDNNEVSNIYIDLITDNQKKNIVTIDNTNLFIQDDYHLFLKVKKGSVGHAN